MHLYFLTIETLTYRMRKKQIHNGPGQIQNGFSESKLDPSGSRMDFSGSGLDFWGFPLSSSQDREQSFQAIPTCKVNHLTVKNALLGFGKVHPQLCGYPSEEEEQVCNHISLSFRILLSHFRKCRLVPQCWLTVVNLVPESSDAMAMCKVIRISNPNGLQFDKLAFFFEQCMDSDSGCGLECDACLLMPNR